jgi:N-acetylmuramoyl-L-alanine amidase
MPGHHRPSGRMNRRDVLRWGLAALTGSLASCARGGRDTATPVPTTETVRLSALVNRFGASGSPTPVPTGTPIPASSANGPVIFLDPGHGGLDEGALGLTTDGRVVEEKAVALAIALRAAVKLRSAGFQPVLSRATDDLPSRSSTGAAANQATMTAQGELDDLQRRIDLANESNASLLLSIHLNASDDPSAGGTETYFDSARSFGAESRRFAEFLQQAVVAALQAGGYDATDRGVIDDTRLQADRAGVLPESYNHLVLLGPAVPGQLRPSQMPGALNEALFLTNPEEADAALDPLVQDRIAVAYTQAVIHFFEA